MPHQQAREACSPADWSGRVGKTESGFVRSDVEESDWIVGSILVSEGRRGVEKTRSRCQIQFLLRSN